MKFVSPLGSLWACLSLMGARLCSLPIDLSHCNSDAQVCLSHEQLRLDFPGKAVESIAPHAVYHELCYGAYIIQAYS